MLGRQCGSLFKERTPSGAKSLSDDGKNETDKTSGVEKTGLIPDVLQSLPPDLLDTLPPEAIAALTAKLQPAIENLPRLERIKIVQETASLAVQFSSPIPPGPVLHGINLEIPGGAERILHMSEKDQIHSHDMDRKRLNYPFVYQLVGLILGGIVTVVALAGAVYCIISGFPTTGAVIFGTTVASIVGVLVRGAWQPTLAARNNKPPVPQNPNPKRRKRS